MTEVRWGDLKPWTPGLKPQTRCTSVDFHMNVTAQKRQQMLPEQRAVLASVGSRVGKSVVRIRRFREDFEFTVQGLWSGFFGLGVLAPVSFSL